MVDDVVPVTQLDTVGLIEDIPPVSLPPNAISDCRNVRFRDGAVHKMQGDIDILPNVRLGDNDILRYVVWWPNPNLSAFNLGYYLLIVEQDGTTAGTRVDNTYLIKVDEAGTFANPLILATTTTANFKGTFTAGGQWQHTFFQGGFSLIINNGLQTPRYILDSEENTVTNSVPMFADLPGWASYAVTSITRSNSITAPAGTGAFGIVLNNGGTSHTDVISNVVVTNETTGAVVAAEAYDVTNNNVGFHIGATRPTAGNRLVVTYNVGANAVTAGVIRTYGDFLIAGNLVERQADGTVLRALPNIIRSSDIAEPGAIPQNWNPFATGVNTADEFVVTGDGIVVDFVELQGNMYVYSNSSISVVSRTGNPVTPLSVRPVTSSYGALTTDSVIEFDGRHFVVGSQDVYVFAGHPGSISSLADHKIRHAFYNRLNTLNVDGLFVLRYPQEDEIWICYSTRTQPGDRANEALIYNYRNQTWTKRDIQGAYSGTVGPVPGGGLPRDDLGFTTTEPTANSGVLGNTHINQIVPTGNINMMGDGVAHQFSIQVPNNLPVHRSTGNPTFKITLGENFFTGSNPPLRFVARATSGGNILLNVNIDLPASIGRDTGSTLVYNSADYLDQVTDEITDHLLEDASIGQADSSSIRLYRPVEFVDAPDDANSSFILEFQNIYNSSGTQVQNFEAVIDIYKDRPLLAEYDLAADDRPQNGDAADNSIDRNGRRLQDQESPDGQVFSFSFSDIARSDLSNYVFFYKGAANVVAPGESITYADLPSGFTIESGTIAGATGSQSDVDNPPSGDSEDGDDRLATNFTTFETGPLLGSRIATILGNDTELDLRIDSNDTSANRTQSFDGDNSTTAFTLTTGSTGSTDQVSIISVEFDDVVQAATGYSVSNNVITFTTAPGSGVKVDVVFVVHTQIPVLNLIAYEIPMQSDGTNDYTLTGSSAPGVDGAASINFTISEAIFDKTTNTWVTNNVNIPGVTAILHYNGVEDSDNTSTFAINQRLAYRAAIQAAFDSGDLFSTILATTGTNAGTITVTSVAQRAYLVNATISGGELLTTQRFSGDGTQTAFTLSANSTGSTSTITNVVVTVGGTLTTDYTISNNVITFTTAPASGTDNIVVNWTLDNSAPQLSSFNFMSTVTQGYRPFTNALTIPDGSTLVIPPCVRIVHNDPDIPFFDFDTGIIPLTRERGNNTALTPEDWMGIINNAIQTAAPNQWTYNYNSGSPQWTSTAVMYNRATDGNSVPYPDADGTYNFPATRAHSRFTIPDLIQGAQGNITLVSTINQQGVYPNQVLGSHLAIRLNDNSVYLFYIGGHTNATVGAYLQTEIERRIPRLQVLVVTNGITIQPSVIGENSVYVEERLVNTEANITRFRQLINPATFTQDTENPQIIRQLPDDVLTETGVGLFPSAAGPTLTGTPTTTYDLVRTWSDTQVNFSVEFPIFAAGRDNRNGTTSNAVLAGDIGYSIPNFTGGTTSYISFIERVQMSMVPEFTTESVKSLALWTDGGSVIDLSGNLRYNVLQLDLSVTNNPGQQVNLDTTPQYTNTHYISEDYKMDTRLTGRFLNWRLSDETLTASVVRNGKTFQRDTDWRVSGMQWKISPAGRR